MESSFVSLVGKQASGEGGFCFYMRSFNRQLHLTSIERRIEYLA